MFGQTFNSHDIGVIGLLILLEGVLSIDNALVLGLLAKRLPKHQQHRALTYGLAGAFVFRFIAISMASYLLQWRIVKLVGGGYLVWIAAKYFLTPRTGTDPELAVGPEQLPVLLDERTGAQLGPEQERQELDARSPVAAAPTAGFWSTVVVIELTDIAFAIDSILAAIALIGTPPAGHEGVHPKLWVVITGGILGVVLMRVAAAVFIKLLDRFPRFETSAYLLIVVVGSKLVLDWGFNTPDHPHALDFHDPGSIAFRVFWILMALCLAVGFLPRSSDPVKA